MSLYDVNTKQFVFAYHKECVSQYYIHLYLYMVFGGFFLNFLGPHNSIWSGRPSLCLVLNLKFLRKS